MARTFPFDRNLTRQIGAALLVMAPALAGGVVRRARAQVPLSGGTIVFEGHHPVTTSLLSDVWGWVDTSTGKEYAIVGEWQGYGNTIVDVHLVDCTNPAAPSVTSTIPNIAGFDMKTWRHYLYTVDGAAGNNGAIVDISNPALPSVVGSLPSAHNVFIDSRGLLYLEVPGLRIYDVKQDPVNPQLLWSKSGSGHDALVVGKTLYDFHGYGGTFFYDMTDPSNPSQLGSITDPSIAYHHSGAVSADGNYLYLNDELAVHPQPDITIWDISDMALPIRVGEFGDSMATVHNSFRVGNFLHVSYYAAGYRVFDISNPAVLSLADAYDTSVGFAQPGYNGAWGAYPYPPSHNIYVTDQEEGLFIFSFVPADPTGIGDAAGAKLTLGQNYPNPFNPTTTISYELPDRGHTSLVIYDAIGRALRTLIDGERSAGPGSVTWNGRDDRGRPVASGVYFYELRSGGRSETRRMLLLK